MLPYSTYKDNETLEMLVRSTVQFTSLVLYSTGIQMISTMLLNVMWLLGLGYMVFIALAQS